jgi:hypothetical protein
MISPMTCQVIGLDGCGVPAKSGPAIVGGLAGSG